MPFPAPSLSPALVLPDELLSKIDNLADAVDTVEWRMFGEIADFIDELQPGYKMQGYDLVAAHLRRRGRDVTARTVRSWCDAYRKFGPEVIAQYHMLPRSVLVLCDSVARESGFSVGDVLDWAVATQATADQIRAHWLPVTSDGYMVDDPIVSGFIRSVYRRIPEGDPRRAVFDATILPLLRSLFRQKNPADD